MFPTGSANNFGGTEVLPLIDGVISEAEFAEIQARKGTLARYAGVGFLVFGVLILGFTRNQMR